MPHAKIVYDKSNSPKKVIDKMLKNKIINTAMIDGVQVYSRYYLDKEAIIKAYHIQKTYPSKRR